MTTTPTSGTADLRATFSEMLVDLPNTEPFTLFKAGFDAALAAGQATAAQPGAAYAELPVPNYPKSGGFPGTFAEAQMRAFADATHTLRASHGQAPAGATEPTEQQILEAAFAPAQPVAEPSRFGSPELQAMIIARCVEKDQADSVPAVSDLPPLPAPDLRDVGTKPQEIKEFLKGYATEYARTAIAARAPADSVQEDAARLDYLHSTGSTIEMLPGEVDFYPMRFRVGGLHSAVSPNLREAIDAAMNKGANHDR